MRKSNIITARRLDDGTIVGTGTHEELLATCTTYQEIVESQQGAEATR